MYLSAQFATPLLTFNGEPERIELEKRSMVCTKGTEPFRAKAGHSSLSGFPPQARAFFKPRPLGVGSMTILLSWWINGLHEVKRKTQNAPH